MDGSAAPGEPASPPRQPHRLANSPVLAEQGDGTLVISMKHKNTRKTHDGLDRSSIQAFAVASQVAFGISASLVGGALLGWYLDQHVFHTSVPLATLIGLLLGLAAGVYGLIRLLSLLS